MKKIKSSKATIGVFTLAMINVAAILSMKNFPALAEYDFSLVFYLSAASLLFFIPSMFLPIFSPMINKIFAQKKYDVRRTRIVKR